MNKFKMTFLIILLSFVLVSCSQTGKCVNVYYFHASEGFNKGLYFLRGDLIDIDGGLWMKGIVHDTEWADRESMCGKGKTAELKEAWYSVHFPDGEILYGTGGVSGIVYVNSQSLRAKSIEGRKCYGYGCKR